MMSFFTLLPRHRNGDLSFSLSPHRKLRDEYDKLEGALRKLGVDPEAVVAADRVPTDEDDLDDAYDDEEDEDDYRHSRRHYHHPQRQAEVRAHPSSSSALMSASLSGDVTGGVTVEDLLGDLDPLASNRTVVALATGDPLRGRHLDILEEVDKDHNLHDLHRET